MNQKYTIKDWGIALFRFCALVLIFALFLNGCESCHTNKNNIKNIKNG